MDIPNFVITTLGCVIPSIISIVLAILAMKQAEKIAEMSGDFQKPKLFVNLFGQPLGKLQFKSQNWVLIHPGNPHEWALFPLRFDVTNHGDATAEGVALIVHTPDSSIPDFPKGMIDTEVTPKVFEKQFKRYEGKLGNSPYKELSYAMPPIHPNTSASITEWFSFTPLALLPLSINATSKDGANVKINLKYTLSAHVAITLLVKDSPPVQSTVNITCLSAHSIDEGINTYVTNSRAESNRNLSSFPFYKRIIHQLFDFRKTRYVNFLAFDLERTVTNKKKTVHILKAEDKREPILLQLKMRENRIS